MRACAAVFEKLCRPLSVAEVEIAPGAGVRLGDAIKPVLTMPE